VILLNCLTLLGQTVIAPAKSKAYLPGEKLTYSLKFGVIHAGQAEIILRQVNYQDSPVYYAKATARPWGWRKNFTASKMFLRVTLT